MTSEKHGAAPRKEGACTWEHITMEAEEYEELSRLSAELTAHKQVQSAL